MATTFLEPGTDDTEDFSRWQATSGTVTSSTAQAKTGPRSIQLSTGSPAVAASLTTPNVLAQAGGRASVWWRFETITAAAGNIFSGMTSGGGVNVFTIRANTDGTLSLQGVGATTAAGTTVLSVSTWYRISWAWTITSATSWELRLWINGVLECTLSSTGTLTNTALACFRSILQSTQGVNRTAYYDNFYFDDSTALTDTGDIRVTAKRPFSNGTSNEWTTQIGSGNSGYGSGHADEVNERPLSTTNGWSIQNAALKTEQYTIEGAAVGDVDISASTIVDWGAWVYAKAASSRTARLITGGTQSNIALTTSYASFSAYKGSTTYPAGNTDVGIDTNTINELFSLAECGVVVAYQAGTGALTTTLGAATLASTGAVALSGAAAPTLGTVTGAATGTLALTGAAGVTLDALTLSADGVSVVTTVGALAVTLDALTASSAGAVQLTGASSVTLDALTTAAAGAVALTGTASVTLDAATLSADGVGVVTTVGTLAVTLDALTVSSTGALALTGTASLTLDALTAASAGAVALTGAVSLTLDGVSVVSAGTLPLVGAGAVTLAALTLTATSANGTPVPSLVYVATVRGETRTAIVAADTRTAVVPQSARTGEDVT